MTKTLLVLFSVLCLCMGGVRATQISYSTVLSGLDEVPSNASSGNGTGTLSYDPSAHTMSVMLEFTGLTGNTTAAHIHCCAAPGANAGVATFFTGFPLGVTSGIYNQLFDLTLAASFSSTFVTASSGTLAGAEAALAAGLTDGKAYFNIHTSSFPGGEIRGNLARVPEPTTLALMSLGIAGIGYQRRRSKKAA